MQFHGEKRLKPIKCPLCGQPNEIIVNGLINNFDGTWDVNEDVGYAFCICHNIFYTNWDWIDFDNYSNPGYTKDYWKQEAHRKKYARGAIEYFPIIYKELGKKASFLEVGFGMDSLLDAAQKLGWKTAAVDIAKRHCKKKHRFVQTNFETDFNEGYYDVIWSAHTFEHFKDPIAMIQKCWDLLNDGGYLFVSMPDPMFIDWQKAVYEWAHWVYKEHHVMWDMDSFVSVMEEIGFEMIFAKHNLTQNFTCYGDYHILARKRG